MGVCRSGVRGSEVRGSEARDSGVCGAGPNQRTEPGASRAGPGGRVSGDGGEVHACEPGPGGRAGSAPGAPSATEALETAGPSQKEGSKQAGQARRPAKSYATAAKSGLQPSHLLHVHLGQEDREFIPEDLFNKLVDVVEERVIEDRDAPKLKCSFTRWTGGKGLLGCQDEMTAKYLSNTISEIRVAGRSFKAWPRGELGRLDRLTFYTPDFAKLPAGKPVVDQMVHQNDLPGEYVLYSFQKVGSVDRTGADRKGWYYHVGISKEMREAIAQK